MPASRLSGRSATTTIRTSPRLLGYASRKLGRYDDAKVWYERRACRRSQSRRDLVLYGMWQAEQGNVLKAKDDLEKVRLICGTDCKAYKMLKDAIDGTVT